MSCNLVIGNTCFKTRPNHLITYSSILKMTMRFCKCEWCQGYTGWDHLATPKLMMVCDSSAHILPAPKKKSIPQGPGTSGSQKLILTTQRLSSQRWSQAMLAVVIQKRKLKSRLVQAAENVCGFTKKQRCQNEWWNEPTVSTVQSRKRGDAGPTKKSGKKDEYQKAKWLTKYAVYPKARSHVSKTLHLDALTYSTLRTKWKMET